MLLYELVTLKLPYEQVEPSDLISVVLDGEEVESMKIDKTDREQYWTLVELHHQCTSYNAEDRPSLRKIVKVLQSITNEQHLLIPSVEKCPLSLAQQLNKYGNLEGTAEDPPDNNIRNSGLKFGGPQTLSSVDFLNDFPVERRFPPPLGINPNRDEIVPITLSSPSSTPPLPSKVAHLPSSPLAIHSPPAPLPLPPLSPEQGGAISDSAVCLSPKKRRSKRSHSSSRSHREKSLRKSEKSPKGSKSKRSKPGSENEALSPLSPKLVPKVNFKNLSMTSEEEQPVPSPVSPGREKRNVRVFDAVDQPHTDRSENQDTSDNSPERSTNTKLPKRKPISKTKTIENI